MKIVTLTLNPAFDTHVSLERLRLHHENFATVLSTDAGGKGVNISRALAANGEENLAVIITGTENEGTFLQKLKEDGLSCSTVSVGGRIRENMTVHEEDGKETRISFDGFSCDQEVLERVRTAVGKVDENTTVTLTGSNPVGLSVEEVTELLRSWKEKGARIVIDSRSFTPADLAAFGPWLIKPNQSEAAAFAGRDVKTVEDAAQTALSFHQKGVENVLISLGPDGAVLACKEGLFHATTPEIPIISTIGAGDSMIAGFVSAASHGLSVEETLIRAVSFGTAACIQNGTRPPLPCDIETIQKQIRVTKISL
ncbi:MAG: 1-phosphofructokinase family hexose kinase [Clostridia bacterium]|nr:1-phosphofructokinase family hexose kinase [Clostridia bacterium]